MLLLNATQKTTPPQWALMQRHLMEQMNEAAVFYTEKYTDPEGALVWRKEWPGMDGSDDGYESFTSFPLFYALGGGEHVLDIAQREWNAVTWQFEQYGLIENDYDAYYDWMHHGESNLYLYYFGLANPAVLQNRHRALKFARMYMGEDPEAQNYDPKYKIIRSPINGGRGPRFEMTAEDWTTHRAILTMYLAPYEDIPGYETAHDPLTKVSWDDDKSFAEILKLLNKRMAKGDVPLNLNSTSLIANAFMYSGDDKYKKWVLDYYKAWQERTDKNGGITPDNVDLKGEIGGNMDGKWWGGYYGYRWPHGNWIIWESSLIAGGNGLLLSGDDEYLGLLRSQLEVAWKLGRRDADGVFRIPARHGDSGWFDYRPANPAFHISLYLLSQKEEDRERIERFEGKEHWGDAAHTLGSQVTFSNLCWYMYLQGKNPAYPEKALAATYAEMNRRLEVIRNDDTSKHEEWDVHHWQAINPVLVGALAQQMMGGENVYHGGLMHARLRYFDAVNQRPGMPEGVAALIEKIEPDAVVVTLVNTDMMEEREVIIQGGSFGEHRLTSVAEIDADGKTGAANAIEGKYFTVRLAPCAQAKYRIAMQRYANRPSYDLPWQSVTGEAVGELVRRKVE